MRLPNLSAAGDLIGAWARMVQQYERDFSALAPAVEDVTLGAASATTTFSNLKIRPTSGFSITPKTANASAEYGNGTIYIDTPTDGQVVINHANNAQTDRIFRITVHGT